MAAGIVESQNPESSSSSQQQSGQRSKLLQRLLVASANLPQFVNDLLTTQAVVVAGTEAAGFVIERGEQGPSLRPIAHIRPDNSGADARAAALAAFQEILKPCVAQAKDGAIEIQAGDNAPEPQFCLVTLLRAEGEIVAASAVITRCRNMERAQQRLMSMQLVAGYFELYTLRRTSEQSQVIAQSHQHVLQLATAVATAEGFESAAMNLCNELSTRTGATRVALGWVKGKGVRVKALSHTEQFDKKQELVTQLQDAMEECIDQEEPVHYDPEAGGTENVNRSAQALSRAEGSNVVLTLPLRRRADVVGAITLEFPAAHKLTPQASTGLSVAVDLLAPQLYDRYQNDRWLVTKAGLSVKEGAKTVLGAHHMLAKLIIVLVLAVGYFISPWSFYQPMYHVSAPFVFDAVDKRKLEAPFDGHIQKVLVKPGDHVTRGQLLLAMDAKSIKLQRIDALSKAESARQEMRKLMTDSTKQAEANKAEKDMQIAEIEAEIYQDQIDRSEIKAPFDGIILKGDLTDQIDAHVKPGDELFVIAPSSVVRAQLSVPERDIQDLHVGQRGQLATTSLPTDKWGFSIDRIVPLGDAKEGDNVFTVYATLDKQSTAWKPGLAGEARIDVAKKPLVWIWTHKLVDYLRLKLWF